MALNFIRLHIYIFSIIQISVRIDKFTLNFLFILGVVAICVRVWSYYYIFGDLSYDRFIILLIAFLISMILLVIFSNLFIALLGWDGLGITSFLLVIYYKNRKCLGSGMITALTNRLGDALLLCRLGFFIIYRSSTLYLLLIIRITKRAQFPFSSWLPSAMAAPTPVRALVHSSTLVTAGVYIIIRYYFCDSWLIMAIGGLTIILAGIVACVERDIKKVVALSTLSQLGVIIVRIGAHEKSYCFFHLLSHACFKALLFICVGTMIHSVFGNQDYRNMNRMSYDLTVSLFATVSNVSLMGFLFTSGYFRKDIILEALLSGEMGVVFIVIYLLSIGFTTFYSVKMIYSTMFFRELKSSPHNNWGGHSWIIKIPMWLLGTFSLLFGYLYEDYRELGRILLIKEKIIPCFLVLLCILVGCLSGYSLSKVIRPEFRSLILLLPNKQQLSIYSEIGDLKKTVDRGWVEFRVKTITTLPTVITHYSKLLIFGTSLTLFFII